MADHDERGGGGVRGVYDPVSAWVKNPQAYLIYKKMKENAVRGHTPEPRRRPKPDSKPKAKR